MMLLHHTSRKPVAHFINDPRPDYGYFAIIGPTSEITPAHSPLLGLLRGAVSPVRAILLAFGVFFAREPCFGEVINTGASEPSC